MSPVFESTGIDDRTYQPRTTWIESDDDAGRRTETALSLEYHSCTLTFRIARRLASLRFQQATWGTAWTKTLPNSK